MDTQDPTVEQQLLIQAKRQTKAVESIAKFLRTAAAVASIVLLVAAVAWIVAANS